MKRINESVNSLVTAHDARPAPRQKPRLLNAFTQTLVDVEVPPAAPEPASWGSDASANAPLLGDLVPLPTPAQVLQRAAEQQMHEARHIEQARVNNDARVDWGKLDSVDGAVLTHRVPYPPRHAVVRTVWGGAGLGIATAAALNANDGQPKDEDKYTVRHFSEAAAAVPGGLSIMGLFDGHCGVEVSEWARRYVPPIICQHLAHLTPEQQRNPQRVAHALQDAFAAPEDATALTPLASVQEELGFRMAGSTALVAVRLNGMLYVVNLGDSRALVIDKGGATHRFTVDHKPADPDERSRIVARGGEVRRCSGVMRVDGVLAMARSLGDSALHRGARPDVSFVPENRVGALILGSDGLYDVIHDLPVGAFVTRVRRSQRYAERRPDEVASIAAAGLLKWAAARGSYDDITVMVALF